jgi:hypothetical protein
MTRTGRPTAARTMGRPSRTLEDCLGSLNRLYFAVHRPLDRT